MNCLTQTTGLTLGLEQAEDITCGISYGGNAFGLEQPGDIA